MDVTAAQLFAMEADALAQDLTERLIAVASLNWPMPLHRHSGGDHRDTTVAHLYSVFPMVDDPLRHTESLDLLRLP